MENTRKYTHTKSQARTLTLNAVNDSQLPRVKAPEATEPSFVSIFEGHGEKRASQKNQWAKGSSVLLKVVETR